MKKPKKPTVARVAPKKKAGVAKMPVKSAVAKKPKRVKLVIEQEPSRAKRFTVSIHEATHDLLKTLTEKTKRPMSGVLHALLTRADMDVLAKDIAKTAPLMNRGRARKYYHRK